MTPDDKKRIEEIRASHNSPMAQENSPFWGPELFLLAKLDEAHAELRKIGFATGEGQESSTYLLRDIARKALGEV